MIIQLKYNVAIQPVLSFGCSTVNIKSSHIKELEKTQGMLIKAALKLPKEVKILLYYGL